MNKTSPTCRMNNLLPHPNKDAPFMFMHKSKACDTIVKLSLLLLWIFGIIYFAKLWFYPVFSNDWIYVAELTVYLMLLAPTVTLITIDKIKRQELGLTYQKIWLQALIALGIAIFTYLMFALCIPLIMGYKINDLDRSYSTKNLILSIFRNILIIAPIEEFIFRGYIQTKLLGIVGKHKWIAPIVSAILFGAIHFTNGIYNVISATLIGLTLGLLRLYLKPAKLSSIMLAHGLPTHS